MGAVARTEKWFRMYGQSSVQMTRRLVKQAKIAPFEAHAARYDMWFERHPYIYESELEAVKAQLKDCGRALEIGAGTGRFAAPLGIPVGLEPSGAMGKRAKRRGLEVVVGPAEALPFRDAQFDCALMVTVVCFLDDLGRALNEVYRVLTPGGRLVMGVIDRESALGQRYQEQQASNPFYRSATFYGVEELVQHMTGAGFTDFRFTQTIYRPSAEINEREPVRPGYGAGGFVVIRARR